MGTIYDQERRDEPESTRTFSAFKTWVVGLCHRNDTLNYGYGGPVKTPFADSIPSPENTNRGLPLTEQLG